MLAPCSWKTVLTMQRYNMKHGISKSNFRHGGLNPPMPEIRFGKVV